MQRRKKFDLKSTQVLNHFLPNGKSLQFLTWDVIHFKKGAATLFGSFPCLFYECLRHQTFSAVELLHEVQDSGDEIQVFSQYFLLLQLCSLIRELAFGTLTL